jgi:signal transduction histidine kinase
MVLLVFTGIALFFVLQKEINDEMNEQLMLEAETVKADLGRGIYSQSLLIRIDTLHRLKGLKEAVFKDTLVYDHKQKKFEDYRLLIVSDTLQGKPHTIRVMDSHIGANNYLKTIFRIFLFMAVVFVIAAVVINYSLSKQIWKPFFSNLQAIKKFSVKDNTPLQLQPSGIREFEGLKTVIEDLTNRSRQEYNSLNEFTENASHEIQTPLSIIRTKLDRLSQAAIDQDMAEQIHIARAAADRLSRVNKNLLLLAKVENNLYETEEEVNLSELLMTHLRQMEELFLLRNQKIESEIALDILAKANIHLCEILISDLLSNALRYTPDGGTVRVQLDKHKLIFANEGQHLPFSQEQLFKRFVHAQNSKGTGLGLAIVKEICLRHQWQIHYSFEQGRHRFTILFA